jgi:hypothetical protein
LKIGLPFHITIRHSKNEHVLTIDKTQFEICHPKVVGEWTWREFKTRKFIVHLRKDGKFHITYLEKKKPQRKVRGEARRRRAKRSTH